MAALQPLIDAWRPRLYGRAMKTTDEGLSRALEAAGNNKSELARRVGVSHAAVQKWVNVPVSRLAAVRDATGIPPSELRPDLAELFR